MQVQSQLLAFAAFVVCIVSYSWQAVAPWSCGYASPEPPSGMVRWWSALHLWVAFVSGYASPEPPSGISGLLLVEGGIRDEFVDVGEGSLIIDAYVDGFGVGEGSDHCGYFSTRG